jgi:TDG/mug DNA glycosylase family protein
VATEVIRIDGCEVRTLRELLRPGLHTIFVGLNPSPVSVAKGHYFQGRLGKRFWPRVQEHLIAKPLPPGLEDQAAFDCGFGFCDLVRRPTAAAAEITSEEIRSGAANLLRRLESIGKSPLVVFVFAVAADAASHVLMREGYRVLRMPSPYASHEEADAKMRALVRALASKNRTNI